MEQVKRHSDFSPSSFERRVYCPASWTMEKDLPSEDTSASLMGTDYHKQIADYLKTGKNETGDWMVDKCYFVATQVGEELGLLSDPDTKTYIEKEFSFDYLGETVNFGTIDFACVGKDKALVIDWKFGFEEVTEAEDNWQLRWYAFFIVNSYDVQEVCTIVYNPRIGQFTRATYERDWLKTEFVSAFMDVINTCKSETEHYMCGSHCRYCKGRMACPAFKECADRYMLMSDKQDLTAWTDEKLVAYYDRISVVKKVIDAIAEEVKRRAVENGHCGKYGIKEQSGGYEVKDNKGLFDLLTERGITLEQFLGFCRVSMTPVFEAIYQKDKSEDKSVTKKTSKEKACSFLGQVVYPKEQIAKVVEIK